MSTTARVSNRISGLQFPQIYKIIGVNHRAADDRLNAAVSRAGFGPAVGVGCASAYERITDLSQTSHEVEVYQHLRNSMPVLVMHVGRVRMFVFEPAMHMEMRMRLTWRDFQIVLMLVVLIMCM